jgi:hypothetical protein
MPPLNQLLSGGLKRILRAEGVLGGFDVAQNAVVREFSM